MHRSVNSANKSIYDDVPLPSELYNIENAGPIESTIEPNLSENNFWFSGFERCSMSTHYCAINSGPVESPMEPNFSENNFRSSGFEMHQPINSYEANERNERKLSSEPFPSHVEKGRVAEIDQHCKKLGENTSAPSLPSLYASSPNAFEVFGSSTDKSAIPYNVFPANVNRPTFLSQQSENYTMRAPPRPSGTGVRFHEDREHDNVPSIAENSTLSLSDRIRKLSDSTHYEPVQLKPNIPYEMRSNFEIVDNINDSPSFNLTEIEREPVVTDGSSGCKRCNCKKSRCLKLYCQCFSLGVYCSDSCACQDCSNKTEYKEIVLQAVQMIKSRNPLAFTPKISGTSANNSGEDGGIHHTVASARHRRGCNCKKSKCLKKYCECYQSGVGCCDRCRCEGCQNVHGQKGVYIMNKNLVSNHDSNKILSDSYNEIANDNLLHDQFGDPYPYQMTLSTPSIPFSNHGETAQNSWVPRMPFRPSYESSSDANIIEVPYHQSSPEMVTNNENYINNGIRPQIPFDGQLQYYGSQNTTMSSFSPGFGVPALDHPLNSANNSVNSMIQSEGTRFLEGDNSNSAIVNSLIQSERTRFLEGDNSNSTNNSVNSLIQSERTRFLEGDNLNSTNNSVNSLIQSKRTKFVEGDSCFRRFSSTFKDGIPKEESAPLLQVVNPPPNKIQVSPPFGIRSAIGLKLNLSRFNPCNDKENNNPNDQQNYSRQDDDGQY